MTRKKSAGIWRYIKEAFNFRWNLLALAGGVGLGILSPAPDVILPLVAAAELAYLAGLTSLPRFQAAIDAKARSEENPALSPGARNKQAANPWSMLSSLPPAGKSRFQKLRKRCLQMRRIANGVRGQERNDEHADDLRTPGLERLLWVFLKLLMSQKALQSFLEHTDEDAIKTSLEELAQRHKVASEKQQERIIRSLDDSIQTAELRLENYRKAESNAEFVNVELDRIEGKIQALTEMVVSNQDPDFISSQVDAITEGMSHTEDAIRELQFITGVSNDVEETPAFLEEPELEVEG